MLTSRTVLEHLLPKAYTIFAKATMPPAKPAAAIIARSKSLAFVYSPQVLPLSVGGTLTLGILGDQFTKRTNVTFEVCRHSSKL